MKKVPVLAALLLMTGMSFAHAAPASETLGMLEGLSVSAASDPSLQGARESAGKGYIVSVTPVGPLQPVYQGMPPAAHPVPAPSQSVGQPAHHVNPPPQHGGSIHHGPPPPPSHHGYDNYNHHHNGHHNDDSFGSAIIMALTGDNDAAAALLVLFILILLL